jgi:glycosyltransferase involved in cell wall biosynthesis
MLAVLFESDHVHQDNDVSFSFAYSEAYVMGFQRRVKRRFPIFAYNFPALTNYYNLPSFLPLPLRKLVLLSVRFICNYPLLAYEILVLRSLFIRIRPDILHINNGTYPGARSAIAASIAGRLANIPSILMVVNNLAMDYRHYSRWFDFPVDRLVINSVDLFITGSKIAAERLRYVLSVPQQKVMAIPNGIRPGLPSETRSETLCRLGLHGFEGIIFGVVALLVPRKGHQVLLDAIHKISKEVSQDRKNIFFVVEGEGPLAEALISFVDRNSLHRYVKFVGKEHNIFDLMKAIDVLVLPSIADEDFPNVVSEAMSLGKPVIGSRLSGIVEQVADGVTGLLTDPGNVEQLADCIVKLANDPKLRAEMGSEAHRRFNTYFTADIAIKNYLKIYSSINMRV